MAQQNRQSHRYPMDQESYTWWRAESNLTHSTEAWDAAYAHSNELGAEMNLRQTQEFVAKWHKDNPQDRPIDERLTILKDVVLEQIGATASKATTKTVKPQATKPANLVKSTVQPVTAKAIEQVVETRINCQFDQNCSEKVEEDTASSIQLGETNSGHREVESYCPYHRRVMKAAIEAQLKAAKADKAEVKFLNLTTAENAVADHNRWTDAMKVAKAKAVRYVSPSQEAVVATEAWRSSIELKKKQVEANARVAETKAKAEAETEAKIKETAETLGCSPAEAAELLEVKPANGSSHPAIVTMPAPEATASDASKPN